MSGILYGVGIGPGDPGLMTCRALEVIKESDVIALPAGDKEGCTSYKIVKEAYDGLDSKEFLYLDIPMIKDRERLDQCYEENSLLIEQKLKEGKTVAFLTLGDPTIYSTYIYFHRLLTKKGYEAVIISGVPSFCAAAAKLGISLGEREEAIHIIPASYGVAESMELKGTKIFMKAGNRQKEWKEIAEKKDCFAASAENIGMPDEKISIGLEIKEETKGYFTTVIIKECAKANSD